MLRVPRSYFFPHINKAVLFSGSAERAAALLPRWTQVFLHQSDPSGRQREVFSHFNVYLHGEQSQGIPLWRWTRGFCLVLNCVLTRSLTRAQTSCSRWPPGTGMSPKSWPTATGGTSCETFSCTFPETAETGCLWLWRWRSDVLQILFKHRGRPQAPTLVQVELVLQLKVPFSFTVTKVAVFSLPHSADTIPPFNRCCLSCEFNCGYVDVSFSHNMQHFLLYCKGERRSASALPDWGYSVEE